MSGKERPSWLVIFATLLEAAETIRAFKACQRASNRYVFAQGEILLCGMGFEAAAASLLTAPVEGHRWLNIGVAGSLDPQVPLGAVRSVQRAALLDGSHDPILIDPKGDALLYSSPTPVYAIPSQIDAANALVDMEGYVIACAAQARGVPLVMKKIVSDYCSETSHSDILGNMGPLSRRMTEELLDQILFSKDCESPDSLAAARL